MTNTMTGIDIRKHLITGGRRPSEYDEQGIFNYIAANCDVEDGMLMADFLKIAELYKKVVTS